MTYMNLGLDDGCVGVLSWLFRRLQLMSSDPIMCLFLQDGFRGPIAIIHDSGRKLLSSVRLHHTVVNDWLRLTARMYLCILSPRTELQMERWPDDEQRKSRRRVGY